jgi:hypothetical protein
MGSQGALDSGNKQAAKALQYTSIGLSAISLIGTGIAIAPAISASFFSDSTLFTTGANPIVTSSSRGSGRIVDFLVGSSGSSASSNLGISTEINTANVSDGFYDTVNPSIIISKDNQAAFQASTNSIASESGEYMIPSSRRASPSYLAAIRSRPVTPVRFEGPNGAIYTIPSTSFNGAVLSSTPTSELATSPVTPGAIATEDSLYTDMSGANAAFEGNFYEDMSGTQAVPLDRSQLEEAFPNGAPP